MRPCDDCKRHVRLGALVCPFCAVALVVVGCHRTPTGDGAPDASARERHQIAVYGGPPVDPLAMQRLEAELAEAGAWSGSSTDAAASRPLVDVSLTVAGSTAPGDERMVAGMRRSFVTCATNAAMADAGLAASPTLVVTIAANGDVTSATLADPGAVSSTEGDCLMRKAKRASFDAGPPRTLRITIKESPAR